MTVKVNLLLWDKETKQVLPRSPKKKNDEWLPALKMGRTIPFGYAPDPDDPLILLPIIEELELLEMAKKLLQEYSSRDIAQWLTEKSGRSISHTGLLKRVHQETRRNITAGQLRRYERLYKETKEAADRLDRKIGGRATKPDHHLTIPVREALRKSQA